LTGNLKGREFGRPTGIMEDSSKMYLTEIGCGNVVWFKEKNPCPCQKSDLGRSAFGK
jgi:hypothetical protein